MDRKEHYTSPTLLVYIVTIFPKKKITMGDCLVSNLVYKRRMALTPSLCSSYPGGGGGGGGGCGRVEGASYEER